MTIQVTIQGSNSKELADNLRKAAAHIDPASPAAEETETETTTAAAPAPKKGKKTAKAAPAPEAETEEEFDLGDGLEDSEEEETEEEEAPAATLEDVITSFKAYAAKHSREKAAKVLTKLGVKSVRDLKASQYQQALKLVA